MELSLLVANAVRERRPELELLVREQVDAELACLTEELVSRSSPHGGTAAWLRPRA